MVEHNSLHGFLEKTKTYPYLQTFAFIGIIIASIVLVVQDIQKFKFEYPNQTPRVFYWDNDFATLQVESSPEYMAVILNFIALFIFLRLFIYTIK